MGEFSRAANYVLMPTTMADARVEILRLRVQLDQQNAKMAKMWEKYNLDLKAMKGQVKRIMSIARDGGVNDVLEQVIEHFGKKNFRFWTKEVLVKELESLKI